MSRNGIVLSVIAVILAACYAYFFTDWFHKPGIQIIPTIRPGRISAIPRAVDQDNVHPVSFALDGKYRLTSIKVCVAAELATNKFAAPLWHLIASTDKGSEPTKAIVYGYDRIQGMKPFAPRARPEPLLTDTEYTLLLEAGNMKSQTNFHTTKAVTFRKEQ